MRRLGVLMLVLAAALPVTAWAQEVDDYETEYTLDDPDWKRSRFHLSGFVGKLTGGTNVGFTENVFFQVSFEQGNDSTYGGRVGYVFLPRFDVELEYGKSSPGLDAVLTDLSGQGRTVAPFADLDLSWIAATVNYSVIDRSRRFVPYLTLGIGSLSVSSAQEPGIDTTEPLLVYGAGLRVRVVDPVGLRADVRGLRSGLGGKQEDATRPAVLAGEFNGTNLVWTVGLELRF